MEKKKTFYAFICQKSCVQKSCVTLELASKVLLQQGQQLVLLSSEVFAEKIVSKQVIQIIKGNLFCQQHLDVATATLTDINMDIYSVWGPLFQRASYTHSALGYFQSVRRLESSPFWQ